MGPPCEGALRRLHRSRPCQNCREPSSHRIRVFENEDHLERYMAGETDAVEAVTYEYLCHGCWRQVVDGDVKALN